MEGESQRKGKAWEKEREEKRETEKENTEVQGHYSHNCFSYVFKFFLLKNIQILFYLSLKLNFRLIFILQLFFKILQFIEKKLK